MSTQVWLPTGEPVRTFDELHAVQGGSVRRLAYKVLKEPDAWTDEIVMGAKSVRHVRTPAGAEHFGKPIGSVIGGDIAKLLPEQGSLPVPKGHIRLYHQTPHENIESIRKNGLHSPKEGRHGDPAGLWTGTRPFYRNSINMATVEFHVPIEKLTDRGSITRDIRDGTTKPEDATHSSIVLGEDVPSSSILSIHEPWQDTVRYIVKNGLLQAVLDGEYDDVADEKTEKAIAWLRAQVNKKEAKAMRQKSSRLAKHYARIRLNILEQKSSDDLVLTAETALQVVEDLDLVGYKDVGLTNSDLPGIAERREKRILQRKKRRTLKGAAAVRLRASLVARGGKRKRNVDEYKAARKPRVMHVNSVAGEKKYGQPIGSIIIADGIGGSGPGKIINNLTSLPDEFGMTTVQAPDGRKFYIEEDKDDAVWVAVDENDDEPVDDEPDEPTLLRSLSAFVRRTSKRSVAPRKAAPARKPLSRPTAAKKPAAGRTTARTGTRKAATTRKVAKKRPALPPPPPWKGRQRGAVDKKGQGFINPDGSGQDMNGNKFYSVPDVTVPKKDANGKPVKNKYGDIQYDQNFAHDARQHYGIPPGWTNVAIFYDPQKGAGGERVAFGYDSRGGFQSKYSEAHGEKATVKKYKKQKTLARNWSKLDAAIANADNSDEDFGAIALMRKYGMRVGGKQSDLKGKKRCPEENEEGDPCQLPIRHAGKHLFVSFGATSLEGRHVVIVGTKVYLRFPGKHQVQQNIEVTDPKIKAMLKYQKSQHADTEQIFQTQANKTQTIMRRVMGSAIVTNKDLRTAVATAKAKALIAKWKQHPPRTKSEYLQMRKELAEKVSDVLGNTPTVALKSYIDPEVFAEYDQWDK